MIVAAYFLIGLVLSSILYLLLSLDGYAYDKDGEIKFDLEEFNCDDDSFKMMGCVFLFWPVFLIILTIYGIVLLSGYLVSIFVQFTVDILDGLTISIKKDESLKEEFPLKDFEEEHNKNSDDDTNNESSNNSFKMSPEVFNIEPEDRQLHCNPNDDPKDANDKEIHAKPEDLLNKIDEELGDRVNPLTHKKYNPYEHGEY